MGNGRHIPHFPVTSAAHSQLVLSTLSRVASGRLFERLKLVLRGSRRGALLPLLAGSAPLDLRIVGRTLWHAAVVGVGAGLCGAAFFGALEFLQHLLLERFAGYSPLRAAGEVFEADPHVAAPFRPWLVVLLLTGGGAACGLITRLAPETCGGGGDAMIDAFHHRGGAIRARVLWVKALASMATLGTGGSGGREGPTMQIGGALGSLVARVLGLGARERRVLLVAGVAAGISAVFRTPLGAALLAVEVLYKDGFESDALIPAVLASVVAYSVVIPIFGETTLLSHAARFPFVLAHLPLFVLLALLLALWSWLFLSVYHAVKRRFSALAVPDWSRPALGGLALGALAVPFITYVGERLNAPGQGWGILGGGYGAVQLAISGSRLLPDGWSAVAMLAALSLGKLLAASLTIGSGGSAGDFAPSLAIGGLFGGAFGRAAQLLLHDPRIDPGAFALVGMGTFYGGIAHVPLSALVLVCELAGNYDLLVPLMLAQGVAFIALRNQSLYSSQLNAQRDSPAYRDALLLDVLCAIRVQDSIKKPNAPVSFALGTSTAEMIVHAGQAQDQDVFPVLDENGKLLGLVSSATLRVAAAELNNTRWTLAADLMQAPVVVSPEDNLRVASERMLESSLPQLPVLNADGVLLGLIDERDVANVYLRAANRAEAFD